MKETVRVAAAQFAVSNDVAENLATCQRIIDRAAAECAPDLLVLPEFCNHLAWYEDAAHAYAVAVPLDGDWLRGIGAKAAEHGLYIKLNLTVRRENQEITATNVLFGPDGAQIAVADKQTLMGNENNFLTRARSAAPVTETAIGRLGMYACADGLLNETSRMLALGGAQILCNSLNSFALDEASLHIPVRAAENRVFVVAACKVGPLLPAHLLEGVAQRMKIASSWLHGAGESQIVAPDGTVLAMAPRTGEAIVYADIRPAEADDKRRPDGSHIFANRRPALYRPIAQEPPPRNYQAGASVARAAVYQPQAHGVAAIAETVEAVRQSANAGVQIVVLPELFACDTQNSTDNATRAAQSQQAVDALAEVLRETPQPCYVAGSFVMAHDDGTYQHLGVLLGPSGVIGTQGQLHDSARHTAWNDVLADKVETFALPFGRVAMLIGDDTIYPEAVRLAALQDVEIIAAPLQVLEQWELGTGLKERAAENRLSIIAASRPTEAGASALITVGEDFTLWTEWKTRPFDGNINYPIVTLAAASAGLTQAEIYPAASGNRLVSQKTDVVDGRPWWLLAPLCM